MDSPLLLTKHEKGAQSRGASSSSSSSNRIGALKSKTIAAIPTTMMMHQQQQPQQQQLWSPSNGKRFDDISGLWGSPQQHRNGYRASSSSSSSFAQEGVKLRFGLLSTLDASSLVC